MENQLVFPMATYIFYICALILCNLVFRIRAVSSGAVNGRFFKLFEGDCPEFLRKMTRHVDNQFQLPSFFFVTCAVHMFIGGVETFSIAMAWLFVSSRFIHTFLHLGRNHPLQRATGYAIGWLAILAMWIVIILEVI